MKALLALIAFATFALRTIDAADFRIERFDPALDRLIGPETQVEKVAEGIQWAEGPVWYEGTLLVSDPPANISRRWTPGKSGLEKFLNPSGGGPKADGMREPGSNGMILDRNGRLLICQGATRRIARWENGALTTIADHFDGKRFSSPNDLAVRRGGEIYFTDPPYGLAGGDKSPLKEQPVNGVYRVGNDGTITRIIGDLTLPNGIAFSPDETTLYVNVSDPANTRTMAYNVRPDGGVGNGRVFFARGSAPQLREARGLFDGLKVDEHGNVWTTGLGGVLVISPQGKLLGRIVTGVPTGNCCFGGEDGRTLFIAANNWVLRVQTRVRGGP